MTKLGLVGSDRLCMRTFEAAVSIREGGRNHVEILTTSGEFAHGQLPWHIDLPRILGEFRTSRSSGQCWGRNSRGRTLKKPVLEAAICEVEEIAMRLLVPEGRGENVYGSARIRYLAHGGASALVYCNAETASLNDRRPQFAVMDEGVWTDVRRPVPMTVSERSCVPRTWSKDSVG
ncbi:hypothetical protein Micbo1qcDRAFT_175831 [Microdochium bolleyi]|uniref:Uncharacterized protein n=1 Tax=Microdochium bolleyi TaxID=196109 RepID=A0A136J0V6_9PEZI|nr:hypothetical protein Micbo1qcDRAFT_175831 [Microdochium bolleyi]